MNMDAKMTNINEYIREMDVEIYAFSGKLGSGKDYIAKYIFQPLLEPKETLFLALADHLKVNVINLMNIPYNKVYGPKDENSRKYLQHYGTEVIRKNYGDDFWANVLLTWVRLFSDKGIKRFMVTDVRFPNEMKALRQAGAKIIRINAPDRNLERLTQEAKGDKDVIEKLRNHHSELALDTMKASNFDLILDNTKGKENKVADEIQKYLIVNNISMKNTNTINLKNNITVSETLV